MDNNLDAAIYVLHIGNGIEFDWTWEGALAFRPSEMLEMENISDIDHFLESGGGVSQQNNQIAWFGEVVEVNEAKGDIYISAPDSEQPPCTGSFFIRPFEFLETLHTIYSDSNFANIRLNLPGRLMACKESQHSSASYSSNLSIPALTEVWRHSWGILWGPPGTGKTYTIGQQVATCLSDPSERVLVISTTNKATDEVALKIGQAANSSQIASKRLLRIGKNANYERFRDKGLEVMLSGSETELLRSVVQLRHQLKKAQGYEERAKIRQELQRLIQAIKDRALDVFLSSNYQVVIATAFRALTLLKEDSVRKMVEEGYAPFTSVIIDEAGLLSRATTAALSLLAARRVLLVGDPKQLAPISKMSRVLPTVEATWLARSGLSHLNRAMDLPAAVHLLTKQYRMHPDIRRVVSEYQYDGQLEDANEVKQPFSLTQFFEKQQRRAIWYVLDEEGKDLPSIRAERGPANRSWVRPITPAIMGKLLLYQRFREKKCLFISPFAAQAKAISAFLAEQKADNWEASTVHSQQGAEAEIVIFDTVNASSTAWPTDEWKRLVNVGISRAKEVLIVLASRAEMRQQFLRPLADLLTPYIARSSRQGIHFDLVKVTQEYQAPVALLENTELLGNQISARKLLRPVLSVEQQRLSGFRMDGKPRLVRGVAGSGKTMVLANWLTQVVQNLDPGSEDTIWVVYANDALKNLIENNIEHAWKNQANEPGAFPWNRVDMKHIKKLLDDLLDQMRRDKRITYRGDDPFDIDAKAAFYLQHRPGHEISPLCTAMFIDEAQDMGHNTLRLLNTLVKQTNVQDPNSRAVNIFYDNAQNVYGRPRPHWPALGLDMRGRSIVMKESFRSTKPITEYALNVLYKLQPPDEDQDHRELVDRHLIEQTTRNGIKWWQVRFAQTDGPDPVLLKYRSLDQELDAIATQITKWVKQDAIAPGDICLLCNGPGVETGVRSRLHKQLQSQGIELEFLTGKDVDIDPNKILATKSHSFKGYDAEVVVIVSADRFVGGGKVLANALYTAMTRSRSLLAVYTNAGTQVVEGQRINRVLEDCLDTLLSVPDVEYTLSRADDIADLLELVGSEHQSWLEKLWKEYEIQQEPLVALDGQILAEPAFWFKNGSQIYACFGHKPLGTRTQYQLEDRQIIVLEPGQPVHLNRG
ncbi:MAG: AAA family ATPase [Caldilineaceae bacterium]|nr:AAA family ATPase [Caldilineaceae bacterium]